MKVGEYSYYNTTQDIDRAYNGFGIIGKFGRLYCNEYLRLNLFTGLGYYLRKYNETINWESEGGELNSGFPITSEYWKNGISIHFGFELGVNF